MTIEDDKSLLENFIHQAFEWLDWCHDSRGVDTPSEWPVLHPLVEFQASAFDAWSEYSKVEPKQLFLRSLNEVSEEKMRYAGLLGAQLKYKFQVFWHRAKQAIIGGVRAKERFVDYLMILLDSLLDMLGVPGTAIKELIGALKARLRA